MFHVIWYILIGLIAGVIAKSVMHVHITIFWTIVLGIIGSIIGGGVTHMFSRPTNERYHPAGLIFSTLGAILVLFICYKLKIHCLRARFGAATSCAEPQPSERPTKLIWRSQN
jgi:uncharacterized membrane protein YeaQ/YmgE (transglycosylase-associated protein family)